ncbi:hypothetical protein [Aliiroseovarius lamellibrachiae]|uniref:hypothetical protein n=1 Tax=Aliiroseovarius lamellibrachiae TaxID=1924933 RepID=UPI001BE0DE8E|nr:hypothetical protein [Aliiroseovarius lamellibrachiae]MBT2130100.1 hypothetical protein [Aliiroseovarius lamellibrachiae]
MTDSITASAQRGLCAWQGTFTEAKRQDYIDALKAVRAGLSSVVSCPVVCAFLQDVLHAELQGAPHIIVFDVGGKS